MKRRAVQRLAKSCVAPSFPELRVHGDLLARWDEDPILRGFLFERHDDFVRVVVLGQPLFVPDDGISLGVGEELGDFSFGGDADERELMAEMLQRADGQGRAFLAGVSDCASLAATAVQMSEDRRDPALGAEIRAYCVLWSGLVGGATAQLDEIIAASRDFEVEYQFDLLTRVTLVREALERSEDRGARAAGGLGGRNREGAEARLKVASRQRPRGPRGCAWAA